MCFWDFRVIRFSQFVIQNVHKWSHKKTTKTKVNYIKYLRKISFENISTWNSYFLKNDEKLSTLESIST